MEIELFTFLYKGRFNAQLVNDFLMASAGN